MCDSEASDTVPTSPDAMDRRVIDLAPIRNSKDGKVVRKNSSILRRSNAFKRDVRGYGEAVCHLRLRETKRLGFPRLTLPMFSVFAFNRRVNACFFQDEVRQCVTEKTSVAVSPGTVMEKVRMLKMTSEGNLTAPQPQINIRPAQNKDTGRRVLSSRNVSYRQVCHQSR